MSSVPISLHALTIILQCFSVDWFTVPCLRLCAVPFQCLPCGSLWSSYHRFRGFSIRITRLLPSFLFSQAMDDVPNIRASLRFWTQNHLQFHHFDCAAALPKMELDSYWLNYISCFHRYVRYDIVYACAPPWLWMASSCPRIRLFVLRLCPVFRYVSTNH